MVYCRSVNQGKSYVALGEPYTHPPLEYDTAGGTVDGSWTEICGYKKSEYVVYVHEAQRTSSDGGVDYLKYRIECKETRRKQLNEKSRSKCRVQ